LAVIQYRQGRIRQHSEGERLAQQQERLRTAVGGAVSGAQMANSLVQRAKDADVTVMELQNDARVLRGTLMLLAERLENEGRQLATARKSALSRSALFRSGNSPFGSGGD
jgi:hypothetical protein